MMTGYGMVQDQNLEKQIEKQMGCMAGFLQLFDRHQILTAKKIYSTKRLPASKVVDSGQVSEKSGASSPAISRELGKPHATMTPPEQMMKTPAPELRPPELLPPKSPLPLPIFEFKDGSKSSWKFCKEAPRLSLDSRATVDAKGSLHPREIRTNSSILTANADEKQRSSPSVIARLMGLEALPDSNPPENAKNVELRRSASESRVSRDLFHYRLIDNSNNSSFQSKLPNSIAQDENTCSYSYTRPVDRTDMYAYRCLRNAKSEPPKQRFNRANVSLPWKAPQSRKGYFDSADFFPEPKQAVSMYGDIEKRLKLRGMDHEPSKDLETLKQILEALQLKGLLHSNNMPSEQRNFVYDQSLWSDESPIVLMKPSESPVNRRMGNESPPSRYGVRRSPNNPTGEYQPSASPRRERPLDRNVRSPTRAGTPFSPSRSESNARHFTSSIVKPKPLKVEIQRSMDNRRGSPAVQSPKLSPRRNGPSQDPAVMSKSPRRKRSSADIYHKEKITTVVVTEDESSSISESTISASSQTDTERSKMEEYREGNSLLERCDKLLNSIAEMNATDTQPSPVSVLDSSSFYKDESSSSSPSPVMKRRIGVQDNEPEQTSDLDEEMWSCILGPEHQSKLVDTTPTDCDLVYISEILVASRYLPEDCDVFSSLEKQQYLKGKDTSKVFRMQRKLIFDIIVEILERNSHLPPWKAFSWTDSRTIKSSVRRIWSEFLRIRERHVSDDLLEIICGVLKKDMAGDAAVNGWGDCPVELSEVVLDIERLIFKDLIGETIRDLAAFACKSKVPVAPRRKLVF